MIKQAVLSWKRKQPFISIEAVTATKAAPPLLCFVLWRNQRQKRPIPSKIKNITHFIKIYSKHIMFLRNKLYFSLIDFFVILP